MSGKYTIIFIFLAGVAILYQQFYGIDKLVLGSDELHPARALISDDWSITTSPPDPEESDREFYKNWPIQFPPLFGLLTRVSVVIFGGNHFALRLFPALFAVLAVLICYYFFRMFVKSKIALVATVVMGMASDALIIYAKSLKHYTADVMISVLLLILGRSLAENKSNKYWVIFTVVASVGVWLAFASIFVSASIFLFLLIQKLFLKAEKKEAFWKQYILSGSICSISYIGLYFYVSVTLGISHISINLPFSSS